MLVKRVTWNTMGGREVWYYSDMETIPTGTIKEVLWKDLILFKRYYQVSQEEYNMWLRHRESDFQNRVRRVFNPKTQKWSASLPNRHQRKHTNINWNLV